MNPLLNDLLEKASTGIVGTVGQQKQAQVAQASEAKKASLGGVTPQTLYAPSVGASSNSGVMSAPEQEYDSRYLTPTQMDQKYGQDAANNAILAKSAADQQVLNDKLAQRTLEQTAADTVSGVGMGIANSLGGIGALGLGILNKDAGLWAAEGLDKMTKFGQSTQSPALQAKRRLLAAENQMDERDSTLQFEQDLASGKTDLSSSLSRIGRDVMSSVKNAGTDPTTLGDGIAQGVGSLLSISPVAGLLQKAGGATAKYGVPLAIGALESGGAYQGTANEIMGMDHEKLMKGSPDYAGMIAEGMTKEEAKSTLANRAGLTSAVVTLPAAIAAGKLVDGFAANPLKAASVKAVAGNLGRETLEEGIQGGTGQLAQNKAIQMFADTDKTLSQGVGEQIGTGALYGLGTAGALQTPSATGRTIQAAVSGAGSALVGATEYLALKGDAVVEKNAAAGPASINRVVEKTIALAQVEPQVQAEVVQALAPTPQDTPETAAPKAAAMDAYSGFMNSLKIAEGELDSPLLSGAKDIIQGAATRTEAVSALVKNIRGEKDLQQSFGKGVALLALLAPLAEASSTMGNIDKESLPEAVRMHMEELSGIENAIGESFEVQKAMEVASQFLATDDAKVFLNDLKQTRESAQIVVAAAQMDATKVNPEVAAVVLKMAQDGDIKLTKQQLGALNTAKTVMRAAIDYDKRLQAAGDPRPKDIVAFQVKTEDDDGRNVDGKRSALQHANHITKLINNGDMAAAQGALKLFGMFAQGQANKVKAINEHFAAGPDAPRVAANVLSAAAGFKMVPSKKLIGVTPNQVGSLRFANTVTAEARFLAQVHNGLAEAYPALQLDSLPIPELDAILQGKAPEVAAEFANGKRGYGVKQTTPAPVVETPVSVSVPPKADPVAKTPKKVKAAAVEPTTEQKIAKVEKKIRSTKRKNPSSLWSAIKNSMNESDLLDTYGKEWKKRYSLLRGKPGSSLVDRVADGALDEFLPFSLRGTDEVAATEYIKEKLRNQNYLTNETEDLLKQLDQTLNQLENQFTEQELLNEITTTQAEIEGTIPEGTTVTTTKESDGSVAKSVGTQEARTGVKQKAPKELSIPVAIKKASDATLQNQLDKEMVTPGYAERLRFKQLDAEMNLRETTAGADIAVQEEAPKAVVTPTPVVAKITPASPVVVVPPPVVDTPPVVEPLVETPPSVEPEAPLAIKTVADAYPNLVTPTKDEGTSLAKAFNLRKVVSRFFGSGSPAQALKDAMQSRESFNTFMGTTEKRKLTPEITEYYRNRVPVMTRKLVQMMNANLNKQLDVVPKNKGLTLRQLLDKGTDVSDFLRGKVLSIADSDGKGGYAYNQELVESAVLAGIDWFQNATNSGPIREEKDIAKILNIAEDEVSPEMLAEFNGGDLLLLVDVVPRIAANITEFWGLKGNNDYTQSATIGIPQAVATEVLMSMMEAKLVDHKLLNVGTNKDLHTFKLDHAVLGNDAYEGYPTLLSEIANSEVPESMYFGDAIPPVAKSQMNNADVALTAEQTKAIEAEQKTPFFLNELMLKLYEQLKPDGLIEIFGAGKIDEKKRALFNKTHLESVEGKNLSITAAFDSLLARTKEIDNVADTIGKNRTQVPVRFAYGISRVGRMQMLGRQNPQASKLVREALMPNQSKIDMTNQEDYNNYMLSVAQMLGVKVHTIPLEDSIAKVKTLFAGNLKDALLLMQKYDATGSVDSDAVSVIKAAMPAAGSTFMGLHAIVDYARLQNMIEDGGMPSEYDTAVYVEADGVTNGPINAMVNLASGRFTPNWLRNVAKGGLFLTPDQTMNEHRKTDGVDLYMASTLKFAERRIEMQQRLESDNANRLISPLMRLMNVFVKDVSINEKTGEIELQRGVAKNPLTITVYGSGARGIANKVTAELLDSIYAKMSEAMQKQAANPGMKFHDAMFGSMASANKSAESMYSDFLDSMSMLTDTFVKFSKKKEKYVIIPTSTSSTGPDGNTVYTKVPPMNWGTPATFKVGGLHLKSLQENMLKMFVEPLRKGIEETVGTEVMDSSQMIQVATNLQSIAMTARFEAAVYQAVQKHARPKTQFLSRNEQQAIMADLIKQFPTVKTKAQEFLIASTSQTMVNVSAFSQALAGDYAMDASVFAPDHAGVAGSPFLNIGMGDGLMMQLMSTMPNAIAGTLKIFDGVNMPVDKIKEGSLQANTAVSQTWQGNPMRAVADSFRASLPNMKQVMADTMGNEREVEAMQRTFTSLGLSDISFSDGLDYVSGVIENMANEIDARHATLKRVRHSVDQMASAEAPYQNEGEDLSMMPEDEQIARLNEIYKEEFRRISKISFARDSNSEELKPLEKKMIPRIMMTFEGVLTLVRKMPADLQETAKQALRSPAMRDYRVIVGTREDIQTETGGLLGSADGLTLPESKLIFLTSGSPEVLVHELVHAATFEKVQSAIAGTNKDKVTVAAVERLKALRDQFYTMQHNGALERTPEQNLAVTQAINSMKAAKSEFGDAAELNELMAWATTNEALIEVGKATKANPSALVKFTRAVVNTIRNIFFGSSPDKLPRDFFNQVRFNTALISTRRQPNPVNAGKALILRHSTAYGNDARLNQIETAYLEMMEPLFNGLVNQVKKNTAVNHATVLTNTVSASFPMSQQQKSTFQVVVGALSTEAALNPASIAKAQELYNHVTKQLEVENFMVNPQLNDPADRFYAQEKYDLIMGKTLLVKDSAGRSSLMPVFFALATVDDSFRTILSTMTMPEVAKNTGTTLDDYLRNYGNNAMEALSNRLSGTKDTDSVREAIDGLQENILDTVDKKATVLTMMGDKMGGWVDTANGKVVDRLGDLALAGANLGNKLKTSNNKYVVVAGEVVKAVSGTLTNTTAEASAEGALSAMSSREGLQPLRDFANDLIGRVGSNADIYDMIKKVRSTVAAVRQEFRENVPLRIEKEFKTTLTNEQWTDLNKVMGKTDLVSLNIPFVEIKELIRNKAKMAQAIKAKEDAIKVLTGVHAPRYLAKSKQLADYMKTGNPGSNLLRNAEAISRMFNERVAKITITPVLTSDIDQLVSLYAVRDMEQAERNTFNELSDDAGLDFTFSYLKQQRKDETDKALANSGSLFNHYKGYIPSVQSSGMSLIVADDTQHARLTAMSYVMVGSYDGAGGEKYPLKKSYYFSNTPTRAPFSQGIVQNVNITAGGVTAMHGYTQGLTAGMINEPAVVAEITKRIALGAEKRTNEQLMPVFGPTGDVIAYERSIDPTQLERLQKNDKLHQMLGVWRGRQVEEAMASSVNDKLVDNMVAMYKKDLQAGRASEYVNIYDAKDPVLKDALKIMPASVKDYMANAVGSDDEFMVRRDMLFDAFGYRAASVGDAWTGNTRFSDETQEIFKRVALGVMGNKAFSHLTNGEKILSNFMSDARTTIVVKSVIVPVMNLVSNMVQLKSRGVPLLDILKKSNSKTIEINSYVKNRLRQVDAEAELRAAVGTNAVLKLEAEIQSLKDAQRRLTIWPLIEAGEFTAISDVGVMHDDVDLSQGRWQEYIEKQVSKLPESIRNAGRYAYITKDTALFQGLQKAVQYGDFLAKAIMYDELVLRKGKPPAEAMAMITEEFINYDRLPGRFRGYLEQIGLLWFYNFKLRSTKVAASMLRNNPVHAFVSGLMPVPAMFGPIGSPIEDNFLTKAVSGTLGYSMGPGMGLRAPALNPWWAMTH